MPSSKLNPPATFNFRRPPRTNSTRGVQKRFPGVSWTVPGEARLCTWLHGAARPCRRGSPAEGSSTAAPRPRDAAMALSGRRRGGRQLGAGNAGKCDSLYVCCRGRRRRRGARSDVPAELHAGGPLTGRRRCSASSIDRERGESYREGKRARPAPPPPSDGLSRDGGLCEASALANWIRLSRAAASARRRSAPAWRSFLADGRDVA